MKSAASKSFMKSFNCLSRREHKLLLAFAFSAFVSAALTFSWQAFNAYNYSIYHEQTALLHQANYGRPGGFSFAEGLYVLPGFHLLTLFIFIGLFKTKKFILPLFLTAHYTVFIFYGLFVRYEDSILASPNIHINAAQKMNMVANAYDYVALSFALILFFWQILILSRRLMKNRRKQISLP